LILFCDHLPETPANAALLRSSKMKRTRSLAARLIMVGILFGPFLLLACGCGPTMGPTVEVSGKVTLEGEPFSEGRIWFTSPRSGAGFNANLGSDGTYALSILDVEIGETYGVFIGGVEPKEGEVDGAGAPKGPSPPPVPAKYWEATTSGLTATIDSPQKATFDFDLESE